jgi:hypothetical protein
VCEAWQSEDARAEFEVNGYDATLVMLEGANDYAPVFHDVVGEDEWVGVPDSPAGEETVKVILDAITAA